MYQKCRFLSLLDCTVVEHFLKTLHIYSKRKSSSEKNKPKNPREPLLSCLVLARYTHSLLRESRLLRAGGCVCVSVCVLQGQKGVGGDGALALALGAG